jgi:hypothetical protein
MLTLHATDRHCATCHHWIGVRTTESDGYIYAPGEVEGICRTGHPQEDEKFCRATTPPHASCQRWRPWLVLESASVPPRHENRGAV